jgi:hypothetical protein
MKHNFMVRDADSMMFDGVESGWFTVGDHDSSYIDLGGADSDQKDPGVVVAQLTGMTSGGSATIALKLIDCATSGGSYIPITPVQVLILAAAYDNAVWDDTIYMPVPDFGVQRYLKCRITIGTAVLTAGKADMWYAKRAQ